MKKFLIFLVLFASHYSANANGVNLSCALDQKLCERCPEYQTIFPVEKFAENTGSLDIEADQSEIIEEKYLLSGNVEVNSESLFLSADNVEVSSTDSSILATGDVKFQDTSYLISSDYLSAARSDDKLIATATNAIYQDYSTGLGGANGFTEIIKKTPNRILLTNSTYSLCPIDKNDWLIDANEIELNIKKNRGYADNAKVKFYGVPIFYTPKYSWVLQGRGSGFLTPSYNAYTEETTLNQNGQLTDYGRSNRLRVPYYFNLAPDRDLILALTYMSSRGFIYEGKYRQLLKPRLTSDAKDSILTIETKYLFDDKIEGIKRWLLSSSIEQDLTSKLKLEANYNRISDRDFFKDIERTNPVDKTLKSNLKLGYDNPENNLSANILTEHEQTVNAEPDYQRALDLNLLKTFRAEEKTPISITLSSTKFVHESADKSSGVRTYGNIGITRNISKNFPVIDTRANVNGTFYNLKNSNNITRKSAGAGINFSFPFEINKKSIENETSHLITPSISYNYRQKVLQGNIPIFDTTDKYDNIITFADLTSGERYTGLDRVTNANDVTLAITTNSSSNNNLSFQTQAAQTLYADDEVVSNTGKRNYETRKSYSDIVAGLKLTMDEKFSFSNDIQLNPDKNEIVKKRNSLKYAITPKKFITIALSDEGSKETAEIYGSIPITKSIHFFGGLDRITSSGVTNKETTGFGYESCCWAARIAHFKEGGGSRDYSYSTGFELVFTGLGSTSSPLKGRIEGNIPGYSANLR